MPINTATQLQGQPGAARAEGLSGREQFVILAGLPTPFFYITLLGKVAGADDYV